MGEFEPILTARWGDPEAAGIDRYLATGGYQGLTKALAMAPDDVIAEVKSSGLRGRGGEVPEASRGGVPGDLKEVSGTLAGLGTLRAGADG